MLLGEPVLSFWAWQPAAVYKNEKSGETQISFPQMWLGTTASVEEVVTAMGAAMALWNKAEKKQAA